MKLPHLRPQVLLGLLVAGTLVVTFVFWRQVSFGRRLDDEALSIRLAADASTRETQHALHEIALRFEEGSPGMDRWAAALVEVSRRPAPVLRRTAAWAMGDAADRPEVAARLREVVSGDPDEATRRNAACSLARVGDSAGRPVLRGMLSPYPVAAPSAGTVESVLDPERLAVQDGPVARLRAPDGALVDVPAPVPGVVREVRVRAGSECEAGALLLLLGPDRVHAFSAAAALGLVGTEEDLDLLRPIAAGRSGLPDDVAEQARRAVRGIEGRAGPR